MRRIAIVALVVIAAGSAIWLWLARQHRSAGGDLVLHGNVDIRQVQVAFNGMEHVARMLVEEGDRIHKGQLLATLVDDRLQAAVEQADARMQAQQQVLARLEAGSRPEEIRKARADVEAAEADARNTELVYRRRKPLAAKDVVSQEQADDAKAASAAARAHLEAAQEALALAVAGPRQEDIAAAKATLKAYEAELVLRRRELADAELYAPADGIIQDRLLEPGDMASPQTPVYTLALTDPLWVRAYVSETDLGKIRPGMSAEVTSDTFPGKRYKAWIGFISPTAEFTPKSVETREVRTSLVYQVRAFVCNPQDELRLGMPASVIVPLHQSPTQPGTLAARCGNA
jgi:multidrug resistance efflux pump